MKQTDWAFHEAKVQSPGHSSSRSTPWRHELKGQCFLRLTRTDAMRYDLTKARQLVQCLGRKPASGAALVHDEVIEESDGEGRV